MCKYNSDLKLTVLKLEINLSSEINKNRMQ